MSLPVPEHLRKEHGVPAEAKVMRALDRWILAYNGPHKAQILSTWFALQMARAIPSWGDSKKYSDPKMTHDRLAAMAGVKRSTFSSRMRHLRTLDPGDPRRSSTILRGVNKGKARAAFIHVLGVVHAKPGFMAPNRYTLAIPDGQKPQMRTHIQPGQYVPPNPDELLALSGVGEFFKAEAREKDPCRGKRKQIYTRAEVGFAGANGAKSVPQWVLDPNLPLSWTARLVMVIYCLKGLLDPENKGLLKEFRQKDAAAASGLSITQVHLANEELNQLGIIRVFSHKVCNGPGGAMRQTPQSVLYLPTRQFTEEESSAELKRYRAVLAARRQARWGVPDEERLSKIHQALINEWQGKEHSLQAFWHELWRRAAHWGCNTELMMAAIPRSLNKSSP